MIDTCEPTRRAYQPAFQWFGGKYRVASEVWAAIGDVRSYVEPFFGSGAMLLSVEENGRRETVNDLDGYLANFWRAVQKHPEEVAHHADWPCNEIDLNSRHQWLTARKAEFSERVWGDPEFCDPKYAGWWVWGLTWWIGSGWCDPGHGPWVLHEGLMVKKQDIPHLRDDGKGVSRRRPQLGNEGQGVSRKLPHLSNEGQGACEAYSEHIRNQIHYLADRLRRVRVCSGDWLRVCQPSVTGNVPSNKTQVCGVFLDPPYSHDAGRDNSCYATDEPGISDKVREWCLANGDDPRYRIVLAGYDGEHSMPDSWRVMAWKSSGMDKAAKKKSAGAENTTRERLWFSPHCLSVPSG